MLVSVVVAGSGICDTLHEEPDVDVKELHFSRVPAVDMACFLATGSLFFNSGLTVNAASWVQDEHLQIADSTQHVYFCLDNKHVIALVVTVTHTSDPHLQ